MCEPASLAMTGMAIGSSLLGYSAQKQQANDQAKYQNQQYVSATASAQESYQLQTALTGTRLMQNSDQAAQQIAENQIEAMKARSHAAVSAGEAGISGNSVDALLGDFSRIEAANNDVIRQNNEWATDQALQEEKGMRAEMQSRTNAAKPMPVRQPSIAALALQIGTSALQGYDQHQRYSLSGPYDKQAPSSGWYKPLKISS